MEDKIQTQHPEGKNGVNISKAKYDQIKSALLDVLDQHGPITPKDLFVQMESRLPNFDGSIGWYTESVKLDLEARGAISHDRKTRQITKS